MITRWKSFKERRDRYFVQYTPASDSMFLAFLSLVYIQPVQEKQTVVKDMEKEFDHYLQRFPVPLMVSAWDFKGDGIEFPEIHNDRFLNGYSDLAGSVVRSWDKLKDCDFPEAMKGAEHRLRSYSGLEVITAAEIQEKVGAHRRVVRTGWWIVFLWAVAVPALIAILGFFNHFYVGAIAFAYSLYRALRKTLEMTGCIKRSSRIMAKEREEMDNAPPSLSLQKEP